MSLSPDTSRARLVREMSRDLNRSSRTDSRAFLSDHGSIPDTTVSDFDPENEALMSTRQLENTTNRLPELRVSARKFARRNNTDIDFVMDTSAIGRAFPDFTMGGSSDDGSDSIELGRGGKKAARGPYGRGMSSREFSSNAPYSVGDESIRSSKAMIGNFEVLSTPPARPRVSGGAASKLGSQSKRSAPSQKENQDPSPPPAKTSDYVSNGSKSGSSRERRTLAEIHARVTSEDDGSVISEERPPTVNLTAKSSRFVGARNRQSSGASGAGVPAPSRFTTTEDFLQDLAHGAGTSRSSHNAQTRTAASNAVASGTAQQSFLLPDLPNLSELVSGVFNDGTPVFSRSGGPRSRFASSTYPRGNASNRPDHIPIESIPVPEEERALFMSLKLLQDKLAVMENEKSEAKKRVEELRGENEALKTERRERERLRRSDSALGMADSASDGAGGYGGRNGNWINEKSKLESTVKSLQTRLEVANRRVSVSEITIKNITQDRDSAISQLGVAFYTSEGLKAENEALRAENETLKSRLAQVEVERENETKNWIRKEASLKKRVERREEAVREVREMTREIWELRQDGETQIRTGKGRENGIKRQPQASDLDHQKPGPQALEIHGRRVGGDAKKKSSSTGGKSTGANPALRGRRVSEGPSAVPVEATRARSRSKSQHRPSVATETDNKGLQKTKRTRQVVVEETVDTSSSDEELGQELSGNITATNGKEEEANESLYELSPRVSKENAREMTDLSFLQVGGTFKIRSGRNNNTFQDAELARMRKTLEEERAAHRRRAEAAAAETTAGQERIDSVRVEKPTSQPVFPRKSSMKDLTTNSRAGRTQGEDEHTGRFSVKVRATFDQVSDDETTRSKKFTTRRRHHSDTSIISKTSNRRRIPADEMTSAFIVPDITIHDLPLEKEVEPTLSLAAQRVLDGLAQHNGQSCTVCRRITSHTHGKGSHEEGVKETLMVPRPVPVSERMPQPGEWNEEPTVRPSQPPAAALAIVMKGLEDELNHLKMELIQYQKVYNSHDASLSKRKRKSVFVKIEALLKAIDAKADQIYALYDVLEGQKADGHEITEEEVEVTLNAIGIDPIELRLRGGGVRRDRVSYADEGHGGGSETSDEEEGEVHEDSNDDDMDLPWEGIEETDI
ncbi:MAG: hypothetical protein M1840_006445 [Geoglossum simile]|nr:MAG: hypothetical protein M1840_006445 [Geoglossum simile]